MITFVVTGGIASGKSYVLSLFETYGIKTYSADNIARSVSENEPAKSQIIQTFGDVYLPNGAVNRQKLGDIVFNDKEKLEKLNTIVHPIVYARIERLKERLQNEKAIAIEIPLLFETNHAHIADVIIHCYTTKMVQVARLMRRNHLTLVQATQRVNAQMPTKEKKKLATFNIRTSDGFEETKEAFELIMAKCKKKYGI